MSLSCLFLLSSVLFFFNDTATTEIYTLSLHDALPICLCDRASVRRSGRRTVNCCRLLLFGSLILRRGRSEEHTSELQSLAYLVCRLLLEKKKNKYIHAFEDSINRCITQHAPCHIFPAT